MKFAVLADIHGNSSALKAVFEDMESLGIEDAVNLGDHFSGPLDAAGTADLLAKRAFPAIRGNHDRVLVEHDPVHMCASDRAAYDVLDEDAKTWLRGLPSVLSPFDGVFMCHGTPDSDETYWLEQVTETGSVCIAAIEDIERNAEGIAADLILCGHTHIPRSVRLRDGRIILNPGSVGCPAYDDDQPNYHIVQTGTPNASYAIAEQWRDGWDITFRSVPYNAEAMAKMAFENGRNDWVQAVRTGWLDQAHDLA